MPKTNGGAGEVGGSPTTDAFPEGYTAA